VSGTAHGGNRSKIASTSAGAIGVPSTTWGASVGSSTGSPSLSRSPSGATAAASAAPWTFTTGSSGPALTDAVVGGGGGSESSSPPNQQADRANDNATTVAARRRTVPLAIAPLLLSTVNPTNSPVF